MNKVFQCWSMGRVCSLQHTMLYPRTGFKSVVNNTFSGECWVCDLYQQYSHVYTRTGYLNFAARLWILLLESSNQKQSHRYIIRWNCNTWTEYTCISTQLNLLGVLIKLQLVLEERTPKQEIVTSWEWSQILTPIPLFEQERRHDSFPEQPTSFSQIWPEPCPNLRRKWSCIKQSHNL